MVLDCCCCPGGGGGGSPCAPLSRTFFVDGTTLVPLASQDGSICRPFATIMQGMAAVAALPPGAPSQVVVFPGTYTEQVVWPDRDAVILSGPAPNRVRIVAPLAATSALKFAPLAGMGAAIKRMSVRDLTLVAGAGQWGAELIAADFAPATVLENGAHFVRVNVRAVPNGGPGQAVFASGIGGLYQTDSEWSTSTALGGVGDEVTNIVNVTTFFQSRSRTGNLITEWDDAKPRPGSGRSVYQIDDSSQVETQWKMIGHPICVAAPGSLVRGAPGALAIDADTLSNGFIAAHTPVILLFGGVGNPVLPTTGDLSITLPDQTGAPAPSVVSLAHGTYLGKVHVQVVGGAGPTRIIVPAYQAIFLGLVAGDIQAGNKTTLDLRTAQFSQASLAFVGDGAIDRSMHLIPVPVGIAVLPATTAVPILPPYPAYVGAFYSVVSNQVGVPVPGPTISAQTATGFAVGSTVPGGFANFTLLRV